MSLERWLHQLFYRGGNEKNDALNTHGKIILAA